MKTKSRKGPVATAGFDAKRSRLVGQIADALLQTGVAEIPLRQLAAHLGTSDRMLLYYFADKANLVQLSLREISSRLTDVLNGLLPAKSSPEAILKKVVPLFASKELAPFMTLWADLAARGSREEEPFSTITRGSVHWWLEWLEERLNLPQGPNRRDVAVAILSVIEGARFIEAFVPGSTKGAMTILSRSMQ